MIRRCIRENGFSRKILPPKQISNADLNRLPTTELPVIVEDMKADQPGAKSISFNDTPDTQFYRGDKFIVIFNKILGVIYLLVKSLGGMYILPQLLHRRLGWS